MMSAPARRAFVPRLAAVLAVAATLAGCLDEAPPSLVPSPTRAPEPTPVTTTYQVGTTVWYEGVVIHVEQATAVLDARGGPVDITLRIENAAKDEAELQARVLLRIGDEIIEPTRESVIPPIPAKSEVTAVMTYELQATTSVETAIVQVGEPPSHVASVPLAPAGGTPVTLEPRALTLSGEGTAGDLKIELTGGTQRWDLPDWSEELPAATQAISITYDATFVGGFTGGFAFTDENVALRLANGKDVPPRADGHSQSIELIDPGRTKRDLFSRFEIPATVQGSISFVVIDGAKERLIPLAIPG